MPNSQVKSVLTKLADAYEDAPGLWVQGEHFKTPDGQPITPDSQDEALTVVEFAHTIPADACFCMEGGCAVYAPNWPTYNAALDAINTVLNERSEDTAWAFEFNDDPNTTVADVIALLREAANL